MKFLQLASFAIMLVAAPATIGFVPALLAQTSPEPSDEAAVPGEEASEEGVDERAHDLYLRGERHYTEGQYEEAVESFNEAYELSERPQLQFNLANAYERLGRYEQAIASLRLYAPHAPEYDHDTIARRIRNLEGRLDEQSTQQGTQIEVQGNGEGRDPILDVAPAQQSSVPTGAIVVLGVGLATLAAATVFGVLSLNAHSELDAGCQNGLCPQGSASAFDQERSFALIADIGFVLGGIATITGASWLLAAVGE